MTKKMKIFVTIFLVAIICACIGGQTYAEEEIILLTDTSVKDDSVKLDTSSLDSFLKVDEQVKEKLLVPKSNSSEVISLSPEPVTKSIEERTVKGPYYLTSVDSAEDILRNEDYVEAVVWYHPVDTEEIKITVRSNTDELQYITYETEIPYEVLDDIVSILRNNPKPADDSEITTEVKRDYVFTSAESARYLIINEAKYGLKMVIWHGIPDTQVISIAIEKEAGIAESYMTNVPRDDWNRIEEVLLQLNLDNK